MTGSLEALFRPRSVAVIGASSDRRKMGHIALRNLRGGKFALHPVNPKDKRILGLRCYPSVEAIPGRLDMALISLPAASSIEPLRECVKKGVGVAIVSSSGFGESGPEGAALERELKDAIKGRGTRLLGPNTMGVYVPKLGLDTMFIPRERSPRPGPGSIAMLSQSGAVSVSFMEKAALSGIGLSTCVGLGNKLDIDENDVLEYLSKDMSTRCVAMYLESFADGRGFMEAVRRAAPRRPVVVLKAGRTHAGEAAAKSHTGAMGASSDRLIDGALAQCGATRAYDEEELIDLSKALSHADHIRGPRVAVVASAGGFGVIAADYVESDSPGAGLKMARLSSATVAKMVKITPVFSSPRNPVDLTAGVTDEMYDAVLGVLQEDSGTDGIMMSLELQPPNITRRLIKIAEKRSTKGSLPIVISAFGGARTDELLREFERRSIPAYPTIWRAVRALGALASRGRALERMK